MRRLRGRRSAELHPALLRILYNDETSTYPPNFSRANACISGQLSRDIGSNVEALRLPVISKEDRSKEHNR